MSRVVKEVTIVRDIEKYRSEIIKLSWEEYRKEISLLKVVSGRNIADYETFMSNKVNEMNGIVFFREWHVWRIYDVLRMERK